MKDWTGQETALGTCTSCSSLPPLPPFLLAAAAQDAAANSCAGLTSAGAGCSLLTGTIRIARDPNAKYGPQGDLVPGQLVTYTITYENEGEGTAYGVYVIDRLTEHIDESTLTVYTTTAQYIPATRQLFWSIGELKPKGQVGSAGVVSFTVRLKPDLPSRTVIFNQATVYFPSVPEETPTNPVVNVVQPLAAVPQRVVTSYIQPVTITLQGIEVSGWPLTFTVTQEPWFGTLAGQAPTLVYTPVTNFTGLDRFTFQVSNGITDSRPAEVEILVNPSTADTLPPEVVWTDPVSGAANVNVQATPIYTDALGPAYAPFVVIGFSEAISATTLSTQTVQMVDGAGHTVPRTVGYDGTVNGAVIVPRERLRGRTMYTVTVTQGVKDLIANPLAADYRWSFRTAATPLNYIYLPLVLKKG